MQERQHGLDKGPGGADAALHLASLPGVGERDRSLCLHEIIQGWAARTPEGEAVFYEGETLSYRDLNERANRLARLLCRHGIGVGSLVGVSMKRSPEMIVALLAILKAGAAYIPLDPRLPQERLLFLVSDAPLGVVLTRGRHLDAGNAIVIDVTRERGDDLEATDFASDVQPGDLAYVIYTSGSTGQPKGVMIPHRGVINWLVWMRNTFEVTPADVVLKKAPLTFDVSAWELFLPLISGACLVLADSDRQYDPTYLADLMASTRVSVAQFVPSLMRSFLELDELPDLSALRHVMCGGEVLTPKLQNLFLERLRSDVCNSYGPTECSIGVTRWPCRPNETRPTVPIGGPIDNTDLYILDENLEPVAPGVAGELYIGGICLGRGYLNRPDLTAERFLPNPFNAGGEARMYRTGDQCRFLEDGSIDFIGRIDDQVKVRGVRIELGEVETAICAHDAVEIAAAAVETLDGEATLAAYVVPAAGKALTERDLRGFLRRKLPQSMIPGEFLFVDRLPLSANGKIDRKSLQLLRPSMETFAAPRDDLERRIAEIWTELLKDDRFGIHDDFFDCGGDSLLSMQLLMRLEREFKTRLSLDDMLDAFTIAEIATRLRPAAAAAATPAAGETTRPGKTRTAPQQEVICRIAEMEDVRGIWSVCTRAFAPYAKASFEDFNELCEHRWLNNPFRTADDPLGWVLETAAGEIVGFHGLVPIPLWVGGQSVNAVSPTTWAADPGHGRAGLTLLSTYMNWGRNRFLLNTTANATTSAMHASGSYGMHQVPIADFDQRLLWVLDFKQLVRWKLGESGLPEWLRRAALSGLGQFAAGHTAPLALGAAGGMRAGLRASLRGMSIKFDCKPLSVEPVDHFADEFDQLWNRLKGNYDVTMERSAAFLNWRHGRLPHLLGKAHVLACRDDAELLGYVGMREPTTTAPGHYIITDLFYDGARPDALHNLMNAAFAFVAERSASALEVFGFDPALYRELESQRPYVLRRSQLERLGRGNSLRGMVAGLGPHRRDIPSATYWYRAPDDGLSRICAEGRWWPSGIDGDLNL